MILSTIHPSIPRTCVHHSPWFDDTVAPPESMSCSCISFFFPSRRGHSHSKHFQFYGLPRNEQVPTVISRWYCLLGLAKLLVFRTTEGGYKDVPRKRCVRMDPVDPVLTYLTATTSHRLPITQLRRKKQERGKLRPLTHPLPLAYDVQSRHTR